MDAFEYDRVIERMEREADAHKQRIAELEKRCRAAEKTVEYILEHGPKDAVTVARAAYAAFMRGNPSKDTE